MLKLRYLIAISFLILSLINLPFTDALIKTIFIFMGLMLLGGFSFLKPLTLFSLVLFLFSIQQAFFINQIVRIAFFIFSFNLAYLEVGMAEKIGSKIIKKLFGKFLLLLILISLERYELTKLVGIDYQLIIILIISLTLADLLPKSKYVKFPIIFAFLYSLGIEMTYIVVISLVSIFIEWGVEKFI